MPSTNNTMRDVYSPIIRVINRRRYIYKVLRAILLFELFKVVYLSFEYSCKSIVIYPFCYKVFNNHTYDGSRKNNEKSND